MKSHNVGKNRKIHQKQRYAAEFPDQHFPVGKKKNQSVQELISTSQLSPFELFRASKYSIELSCPLPVVPFASHKVVTSKITILLPVFFNLLVTNIQITLQALPTGTKLRLLFSSCKKRGNCI